MSAPWFRTTDMTRWGPANSGGPLSGVQYDENTWWAYTSIVALQARPIPSEIAYFTLTGDQLLVVMTDHSTRGPYTIPTSAFRFTGAWQPNTAYLVNDVFTANGSTYIVIFAHTSKPTFDPGQTDGSGHQYYGLMLANPGNALPTGGAVGQFLMKSITGTDFASTWEFPLPNGGGTNALLMKNSATNQDFGWRTPPFVWAPPVSPPGEAGWYLKTLDGTSANTEWAAITAGVAQPPLSPVGHIGDVLATADGTATNMEWLTLGAVASMSAATTADYLSNTANKVLTTDQAWAAAEFTPLTDASTIALDMNTFINASVTLAGNRTLANPTNIKIQAGVIEITQDSTGSRTLTLDTYWKTTGGVAITLSTAANAVDLLFYQVLAPTVIFANLIKDSR